MGKVLGIVNRKGGVGKTTTATTLSYLLSKEGCKVALIDFDGQRHTTKLCGVTAPEQLSVTIYDILKCIVMNEELPDKGSYMIRTETGVDLIPANNKLDNFDKLMCDTDFAEYKLKEFVDTIKEQYDYIPIDGMPKMGTAMINVMICCDSLDYSGTVGNAGGRGNGRVSKGFPQNQEPRKCQTGNRRNPYHHG